MTKKYIKRAVLIALFYIILYELAKKVDKTGGGFGKMKMQKAFE